MPSRKSFLGVVSALLGVSSVAKAEPNSRTEPEKVAASEEPMYHIYEDFNKMISDIKRYVILTKTSVVVEDNPEHRMLGFASTSAPHVIWQIRLTNVKGLNGYEISTLAAREALARSLSQV